MMAVWERTLTVFARKLVRSLGICGLCAVLTAGVIAAEDNGIDPELRADIERLMDVTKAADTTRQMGEIMAQLIVQKTGVDTPEAIARCRVIAAETIEELFADDELMNDYIPIYAKYFTHDDVRGMIAFYETPVGKKTIEVTPSLIQESMQVGQRWVQQVMPGVEEKVTARLKAEGIME